MQLELVKNPDIISTIAALEKRPFTVGFAAETIDVERHGAEKLTRKKLDLLFANDANATLGSDSISATALWPKGTQALGPASKRRVALQMLELIHAQHAKTIDAK